MEEFHRRFVGRRRWKPGTVWGIISGRRWEIKALWRNEQRIPRCPTAMPDGDEPHGVGNERENPEFPFGRIAHSSCARRRIASGTGERTERLWATAPNLGALFLRVVLSSAENNDRGAAARYSHTKRASLLWENPLPRRNPRQRSVLCKKFMKKFILLLFVFFFPFQPKNPTRMGDFFIIIFMPMFPAAGKELFAPYCAKISKPFHRSRFARGRGAQHQSPFPPKFTHFGASSATLHRTQCNVGVARGVFFIRTHLDGRRGARGNSASLQQNGKCVVRGWSGPAGSRATKAAHCASNLAVLIGLFARRSDFHPSAKPRRR